MIKTCNVEDNRLTAYVDHFRDIFTEVIFHDKTNSGHPNAKRSIFDFPFLFPKCSRRPAVIICNFKTFHVLSAPFTHEYLGAV
ncbi:hypothetical protein TGS27_0842 [Geobacillus stearothermophilus]|nr:hypothetical protein TGS27_0842 [Geobacillus stearothermophilus]